MMPGRIACFVVLLTCLCCTAAQAQSRQAPPGMFKDLDDEIAGDALILHGKQLFIDDYIIEELRGAKKALNQPVKHPKNPLLKRDKPWEVSGPGYGTVIYDAEQQLFKIRHFRLWRFRHSIFAEEWSCLVRP